MMTTSVLEDFDGLLADYVDDRGMVDYAKLKTDGRLSTAVVALGDDSWPQSPASLAFWLNAYNLLTLALICDHYPLRSISDLHKLKPMQLAVATKRSAWDVFDYRVDGQNRTLNDIEHKIVRKHFAEPRVHAALVCAAMSCPPLRAEAYRDEKLDEQLDDQMRRFIQDPRKNLFELERGTARVSMIFSWYAGDFLKQGSSMQEWLVRYLPAQDRAAGEALGRNLKLKYLPYDWSLNNQ
jgi:hypothetical protein